MIIFCYIDWTLADCGHRVVTFDGRVYSPGGEFFAYEDVDWKTFNKKENILRDVPFDYSCEFLQYHERQGHEIVYVTSRERKTQLATVEWLWSYGFPYGKVFCCTANNSGKISSKEYVFIKYRSRIDAVGAVLYDDDFGHHIKGMADRHGIILKKPDYVYGKRGFWKKEYHKKVPAGFSLVEIKKQILY
jgi:predicted secreted acid phosphatase